MEKNINARFTRQPKFFKDFHCIGGDCPISCCQRWRIDYNNEDVEKLKKADCSENLRMLIKNSFESFNDMMHIKNPST